MSFFKKKSNSDIPNNCWICKKCKTCNSLNTNVCITCHSINHDITVSKENNNGDSFLFKKSSEPAVNNCPPSLSNKKHYKCSECGLIYNEAHFCPSCGSKAHTVVNSEQYINSLPDKEQAREKKTAQRKLEHSEGYKSTWHGFVHLSGLPLPQKTECEIWECDEKIIIRHGASFSLNYSQIIDIECISSTEVQKHYVDKTSGAVAGGMLFGVLGAIMFGGTKTIVDTETTYFLTITYSSNGEIKYLIFDVTSKCQNAKNFIKQIRTYTNINAKSSIEL